MICAGIGFNANAIAQDICEVISRLGETPDVLVVLQHKTQNHALLSAANSLGLRCIGVEKDYIYGCETPSFSKLVFDQYGTGCVSEALALFAAKSAADQSESVALAQERIVSKNRTATAALAQVIVQ